MFLVCLYKFPGYKNPYFHLQALICLHFCSKVRHKQNFGLKIWACSKIPPNPRNPTHITKNPPKPTYFKTHPQHRKYPTWDSHTPRKFRMWALGVTPGSQCGLMRFQVKRLKIKFYCQNLGQNRPTGCNWVYETSDFGLPSYGFRNWPFL